MGEKLTHVLTHLTQNSRFAIIVLVLDTRPSGLTASVLDTSHGSEARADPASDFYLPLSR